jgi:hypothetical protein
LGKTHSYDDFLGYIRIDGPDIEAGHVDFQSISHIIVGTEKILTHFLSKYDSSINDRVEVNFPVEVRQGCWEILIPVSAAAALLVGRPLSAYLTEAAKELAKNDVGDKTTKEVLVSAIRSAQTAIKIAKHLGTMKHKHDLTATVKNAQHITIKNSQGREIIVSKKDLEDYQTTPKDLFSDISYPAVDERSVHIGYIDRGTPTDQAITSDDRGIFYPDDDEKEELFPELEHGQTVDIEGKVTRGNQRTNTIGFEYKGHILTCSPINNYVSNFLQAHYRKCIMHGIVSRQNEVGEDIGRPRIYFTSLNVVTETDKESQQHFL